MNEQATTKAVEGRRGGQSEVMISQGATLTIQLEGNPATGYAWTADRPDAEIVSMSGSGYEAGKGPGLTGAFVFTITGKATGTAKVSFNYQRPWEKDSYIDPANTFQAVITVV